MKSTDDKGLIPVIVASEADSTYIRTIPAAQPATGDGSVSLDLGLPPECATSVAAGGKRPEMKDMNGIWNLFSRAIQSLQAYRGVYDSSFAASIGGYPKNAMVSDSSGNFWVSTADQNTTVPGASGANWQSLFNGYATEAWSKGQFLQLALATLQSVAGPVAFTGKTTVPDVSAFTGTDALNAETAEGRYVKSVPATGQTRITSLVENSDGRAVFGDGTNSPVLANLDDLPSGGMLSPTGLFTKIPLNDGSGKSILKQRFTVYAHQNDTITFPIAYSGFISGILITTAQLIDADVAWTDLTESSFIIRVWNNAAYIQFTIEVEGIAG